MTEEEKALGEKLRSLIGKYVDIGSDVEGMSGYLVKVGEFRQLKEQSGYTVEVDYGMGWFVDDIAMVKEIDPPEGYPKP